MVNLLGASRTPFAHLSVGIASLVQHVPCSIHHYSCCFRWRDDDDVVRLYEVSNYESAGVWIESSGEPCLVIWASFDDGTDCMRLLYTEQLVKRDKDVDDEGQWLILDTGTGEHLQDMGTYIKADGKAQGPLLSEVRPSTLQYTKVFSICRSRLEQPGW